MQTAKIGHRLRKKFVFLVKLKIKKSEQYKLQKEKSSFWKLNI